MDFGQKLFEGAGHFVYEKPGQSDTLFKIPRNGAFSLEDVKRDIRLCRERFGQYFPETKVEAALGVRYIVTQKRVRNASHIKLGHLDSKGIRSQVENVLALHVNSVNYDGVGIDFAGLEGSTKCYLYHALKFRGRFLDNLFITPAIKGLLRLKEIESRIPILDNTLELWKEGDLEPEIANLVVNEGDERVYLVDTSLIHMQGESFRERGRARFLNWWNRRLLKIFFGLRI